MYKIKTSNKLKLGKLKVRFSDVLLSDTEMKNVIGGANGPSDVTCNPQASESSCNGVCYSGTKQVIVAWNTSVLREVICVLV